MGSVHANEWKRSPREGDVSFKDHFSGHAGVYATYRPRYPDSLFGWLAEQCPERSLAWDCATGNGQAAVGLSASFERVHASDASSAQVSQAEPRSNVTYACEPAEHSTLAAGSVDLVTVAQALHWFDFDRFYAEANRVLKPRGVIAAWCYETFELSADLQPLVDRLYGEILGPYWPPERRWVEEGYRTIPWPFDALTPPKLELSVDWPLSALFGYLRSWSATQRYQAERGVDPVLLIEAELSACWGDPKVPRRITWPLSIRAGRKPSMGT
jgi:SAM-dependent methyltransferase